MKPSADQNRQARGRATDLREATIGSSARNVRNHYKSKNGLWHNGFRVASKAELSCIKALEKFCNWEAVEGITFQVPIGHGKTCDFKVDKALVEFHPIILIREMSRPIYNDLKKFLDKQPQHRRRQLKEIWREHLLEEYSAKRDWTIRQHADPDISNSDLIIVTDADSFLEHVVRPNQTARLPRRGEFVKMFRRGQFG